MQLDAYLSYLSICELGSSGSELTKAFVQNNQDSDYILNGGSCTLYSE